MDTPISPDVFFTGKKKGEILSPLEQIGMDYATPTEKGTPKTPLLVDTLYEAPEFVLLLLLTLLL